MLARAYAFTLDGLDVRRVTVEVDVRNGLPAFTIIGLADTAIREARERVRAAVINSGFDFPARRITANLAPADVPKAGPGLDLALACALLCAVGHLPAERLDDHALLGELALDGSLRAAHGTLAIAHSARCTGLRSLVVPAASAAEAQLVPELRVAGASCLSDAVRLLRGERGELGWRGPVHARPDPHVCARDREYGQRDGRGEPDLRDVRGAEHAVRALVIAAAGGHNLLLSGPPGTGKTMLAHRLAPILPALTVAEAVEVARIDSLAGNRVSALGLRRPFRAPHHSITAAGMIGGARGCVGEVVRAHNGVLFLDNLSHSSSDLADEARRVLPRVASQGP